jgi:diguanylate cyclase (GGDEF)-like protein/PAS domain S-box-containing protein
MRNVTAHSGGSPWLRTIAPATLVTVVVGLMVTAVLYLTTRSLETERSRSEFEQVASSRFAGIEDSFDQVTDAVRAINLLFVVNAHVSRQQFQTYSQGIRAGSPFLQALVFHRFVSGAERAAFEAERRRIWPGFQITQRGTGGLVRAPPRERYLVDDYVSPFGGNEVTIGFDAWSEPGQRAVAQAAIDTGQPKATGAIRLLQDGGRRRGMVVVMPVYRHGATLHDVAARRAAAIGDTEAVVDLDNLLRNNLRRAGLLNRPGVAISVAEMVPGGDHVPVFDYNTLDAARTRNRSWLRVPVFAQTRHLDVAGSKWQATVSGYGGGMTHVLASVTTLLFGIVVSLTAGAFAQTLVMRKQRVEQLVRERTAALALTTNALRLHRRAIDSSANAIIIASARQPGYPIEYVNPAHERMMGYTADEILGQPLRTLAGSVADQPGYEELRGALRERREGHAQLRHKRKDGSVVYSELYVAPVNDAAGRTEHFVVTQYDITTAKTYEAELERHAHFDTLTGLPNRALLIDRIGSAITQARASGQPVWIAVMDLDHFKTVNDTLGHATGDQLLQLAAPRIVAAVNPTDTVARTGGDEFVLALTGRSDEHQAEATVRQAMAKLAETTNVHGHPLVLTCSAGLAGYPSDGTDAETLLKHAEVAMYRAKETGRNTVRFFTPSMNERALERLTLETALRTALADGQFELHYQPKVDPANGWVGSGEALIRWHHPQLGMIRPERFVPLAEETGLIVPIGDWVLRTACAQCRAWQDAGYGPFGIAVNLSARQFADPGLKQGIAAVLAETGLAPGSLEIELTETLVMSNVECAIRTMRELKLMGVKLSMDDFGTGYSSLSYLQRFPVDVLKIDRSFVVDVTTSPDSAALVDAIISLAHGLRMEVVAEGVETADQLNYLRNRGCDVVQGYVYSRAVPRKDFERILREGRRVAPVEVVA